MKNKILSLIACSLMILSSTTAYAQELPEGTYEESTVEEVVNQQEQSTTEPVLAEETAVSKEIDATAEKEDTSISENEEVLKDADEISEEENLTEDEVTEEETEENLLLEEELLEEEEDNEDETYVVSFYDPISEDVFYSVEVKEGESVEELPEAPTHFNGKFYGYKGEYTDIEKDTTIVALYTPYYSVYELKSGKGTISGRTYDSEGLYLPNAKVVLNINGQTTETVSSESAYYDLDIDMTDSFTGTIEFYDENENYLYKSYICFGEEVSYDTSLIGEDLVFDDEEDNEEEELEEDLLVEETKEDELVDEDTTDEELLIDESEETESTEDPSEDIEEQTDDYIEPEQTQIEESVQAEGNSSDEQSNTSEDNSNSAKSSSDNEVISSDDVDIPESVIIEEQ